MKPALLLVVAGVCGACWWVLLTRPLLFACLLGAEVVWTVAILCVAPRVDEWRDKRRAKQDWPAAKVVESDWGN
jgi:hypothetical protein